MHYRNNKLKFNSSKDVKNELSNINGSYNESMNMYKIINCNTDNAIKVAKNIEDKAIKNKEDLYKLNPYTGIYKIVEEIKILKENDN